MPKLEEKKQSNPNDKIENDCEDAQILDAVRYFSLFPDETGIEKKIAVKQIGKFEELIGNNQNFSKAKDLVDIFRSETVLKNRKIRLPNGKEVNKSPHLLIAGGFVRDTLLGEDPHDIDFATDLESKEVIEILKNSYGLLEKINEDGTIDLRKDTEKDSVVVKFTGKRFGVIRIIFNDKETDKTEEYEIASFRKDSEESDGRHPDSVKFVNKPGIDAKRRDLTCNALFYNPLSGRVIDYVGGLNDIENKKLRFVGDPGKRINEDATRMIRYVRFLLKTGFSEDGQSLDAIRQNAKNIEFVKPTKKKNEENALNIPLEREKLPGNVVRLELEKLFKMDNKGTALEKLKNTGLLREIFPDVEALENCMQGAPYNMEGNAFLHTQKVLDNLPRSSSFELVIATILHDIGKPATRKEDIGSDGKQKVSFVHHERESVEMSKDVLERLNFSKESTEKIVWLIKNHVELKNIPTMKWSKIKELVLDKNFDELLVLRKADRKGSVPIPGKKKEISEEIAVTEERINKIRESLSKDINALIDIFTSKNNNPATIDKLKKQFAKKNYGDFNMAKYGALMGAVKNRFKEKLINKMVANAKDAEKLFDETIAQVVGDKDIIMKATAPKPKEKK